MDHYVGGVALGLLLEINNKAMKEIPEIRSWGGVDEVSENCGSYNLYLGMIEKREAFCRLGVVVNQIDKELVFEVFTEHEEHDFKKSDLHKINIENLMSQYSNLKPVVTEGIVHLYGDIENGKIDWDKRVAKRTFKVSYKIIEEFIKENEDYSHDYDLGEMSKKAIPYIKSLLEIFKVIHPSREKLSQ